MINILWQILVSLILITGIVFVIFVLASILSGFFSNKNNNKGEK